MSIFKTTKEAINKPGTWIVIYEDGTGEELFVHDFNGILCGFCPFRQTIYDSVPVDFLPIAESYCSSDRFSLNLVYTLVSSD